MRIFVISGYGYWGDFVPTDLYKGDRQIGGGETAMVSISKELAALGHEVVVFYDIKTPGRYDGVDYLPTNHFVNLVTRLYCDVLVAWDAPHAFRFCDHAAKRVLAFQLNDAQIGVYDWTVDYYFHPSQWHQDRFKKMYPEITTEKCFAKMTNGISFDRYADPIRDGIKRTPHRVIYSSSPDRGLHHLLEWWPKVHESVPDAELHVFYEVDKWLELLASIKARGGTANTMDRGDFIAAYRQTHPNGTDGVVFHGGVGQATLAKEQLKSAILAYPCDPVQPTEGFSMTVLEGITAGCQVITTQADALPELWSNAPGVTMLPIDAQLWTQTIIEKLQAATPEIEMQVCPDYSWASIARKWEEVLCSTNKP